MKQFCCGDVVPGCQATFQAKNEAELFALIGSHARRDHGFQELPAALVEQVRASVKEVNAA